MLAFTACTLSAPLGDFSQLSSVNFWRNIQRYLVRLIA